MVASTLGTSVAGPFVAACVLLVVSGAGKVARPAAPRVAVRAAGLPWAGAVVATFGIVEVAAGVSGAILGGAAAVFVAGCYLALAAFAYRLLRHAPSTPCACLGASRAVVTPTHVVLDLAAAAGALVAATSGSPWTQFSGHWIGALTFTALIGCCVQLAALALDSLPALAAATKEGSA